MTSILEREFISLDFAGKTFINFLIRNSMIGDFESYDSDNDQVKPKFFMSLHFTDPKFKHNLSNKGSDKEPLSKAFCDNNLMCSALEKSVQKDNIAWHIHHNKTQ